MASSTGWIPSKDGKELAPFPAYQELVEEDARPFSRKDPNWTAKTIQSQLETVPNAAPAIQESVLGLWRLKLLEGELEGATNEYTSIWQQYVTSLLVSRARSVEIGGELIGGVGVQYRHRDLCLEAQISPLQVVVDFAVAMGATGNLLRENIPYWDGDVSSSDQEGSSAGKGKTRADEDDVEMSEPIHDKTPKAKKKGVERLVLPIVLPLRNARSISSASEGSSETGNKRSRPATPSKEEGQSTKRPRATKVVPAKQPPSIATTSGRVGKSAKTTSKTVATISLGEYKFAEFTKLTEGLVPGIGGKVSRSGDWSAS